MRAATELHELGVAREDTNFLERHAEPLGHELREARLVTLPRRDRPDDDIHASIRMHGHVRALARHTTRRVDVVRNADATALASRFRLGTTRRKARPVAELECFFHN